MTMKGKVKAADAIRACAAELAKQSWCVDLTGSKRTALHALSDRSACIEALAFEFKQWAAHSGIEVCEMEPDDWKHLADRVADKLPNIYGSTFRPVDERFVTVHGVQLANTFVPFKPDVRDDAEGRKLVDELFERLFPDSFERHTVKRFFAHMIQKPLERPQWGLLITGDGGTGKSQLVQLAERALNNRHRWRENVYKPIGSQFSSVLPDNLLVTFDDAPASGNTYEELKFAITRSLQEVEIKGQQKKVLREVFARIVVVSNEETPLTLKDDRRFFVPERCRHFIDRDESGEFFERFFGWLERPHTNAFLYHYFRGIDLNEFDPSKTVRTATLLKMEGQEVGTQVRDLVREFAAKLEIFHETEVLAHARRRGVHARPDQVCKALAREGYIRRRRPHPGGTGQIELWCPASIRRTRSLTQDERQRIIEVLSRSR